MLGFLKTFLLSLFSRLHLNKKTPEKVPYSKLAGVSLLKPLKGVDPNLINNLETFFELDYPKVPSSKHFDLAVARAAVSSSWQSA